MGSRVYIGQIAHHAREKDIEKFFRGYGRIREILLKYGYGFVEFDDYRDADDAVYELNGKDLCGERVIIEHARGPSRRGGGSGGGGGGGRSGGGYGGGGGGGGGSSRRGGSWMEKDRSRYGPPVRTEYRLVVENLSSRVSWQDLKDYMRQAGEVTYADAHKQKKNEGIVEFATYSDMKNALDKLDDTEINGRRIRLVEDRPRRSRKSRSRSRGSRSRSRSRRRTRSRSRSRSRSRTRSKSRSRSRSRDRRDRTKSRSHSRSRSARSKSKSRSRSRSHTRSKSRSRSRSKSKSRSKSRSPAMNNKDENHKSDKDDD